MAKAKSKLYAIKSGVHPATKQAVKNVVLHTWAEAEPYIKGVKGAEYKSWSTEDEVQRYFLGTVEPDITLENPNVLYCYVDGSFNADIPNYSFGIVCVKQGKIQHLNKGVGENPDAIEMQQVAGELLGAIKSLIFAKENRHLEVVIFYDYNGVKHHAIPVSEGGYKRSSAFSETYYQWMQKFRSNHPDIKFVFGKVLAHSGNDYNEIADGLAKLAVGLIPNPVFYRMVEKHGIDEYKRKGA
jgi:ribonuclease HI